MAVDVRRFTGFRPEAIDFLAELAQNNDRGLVPAAQGRATSGCSRSRWRHFVAAPRRALRGARRLPLQADPKRSIFRIYRDTRFAKDKSPYKTHVGRELPVGRGDVDPDAVMSHTRARATARTSTSSPATTTSAAGCGMPSKPRLDAFRQASSTTRRGSGMRSRSPRSWPSSGPSRATTRSSACRRAIRRTTRSPTCFRYKDIVFGRRLSDDEVYSPALPDILADAYATATPVFRFLSSLDA